MNLRNTIASLSEDIKTGDMYQAGYNSAVNTVLALPELQTTIEKAEKYDRLLEEGMRV